MTACHPEEAVGRRKDLPFDFLEHFPDKPIFASAGAGKAVGQPFPAFADPSDLTGGDPGHQSVIFYVAGYHGTRCYEGAAAYGMAAYNGAVRAQRRALAYERARVRTMHRKMSPRSTHIREYARRTTENIVFDFNALIDGDVVLDPDTVPDPDMVRNVDILSQRTVPADDGAFLNVTEMPNLRSFADAYAIVDIRAFMNETIRHPSFFQT